MFNLFHTLAHTPLWLLWAVAAEQMATSACCCLLSRWHKSFRVLGMAVAKLGGATNLNSSVQPPPSDHELLQQPAL